jgi:hypothetical protein
MNGDVAHVEYNIGIYIQSFQMPERQRGEMLHSSHGMFPESTGAGAASACTAHIDFEAHCRSVVGDLSARLRIL